MTELDTDSLIDARSQAEARAQREARRQNIEAQSQAIGQQLRATNRRDRGRIAELQSQQRGLDQARTDIRSEQRSEDAMTNLRVQSQLRNAHLATKALDDQRHEETARQVANISNGLSKLEAKYPNRGFDASQSEKFHAEVEQLGNENAFGMQNRTASARMFQAAQFQDQIRQKTLSNAARTLATLTKGGLSPEEFANRDHSKDFTTNAADLASAQSQDINVSKRPKSGEPVGVNTVFNAGGANWMIPTTSFSRFDSNFKLQPTAQTAPVGRNNYVAADPLPQGTNYTFSGTQTPNHPGDYWSEQLPRGLVRHHFASGGSATGADKTQPEGEAMINAARQQGAERGNVPFQPIQPDQPAAAQPNVLRQPYQGDYQGDESTITPRESQFWSQNPLGAVPHPRTGQLVGLGTTDESKLAALQSVGWTNFGATTRIRNPQAQAWYDQRRVFPNSAFERQYSEDLPHQVIPPAPTTNTPESTQLAQPQPTAPQPTGTLDPRIELAQRALTDPNATDAHRAAARQILGIKEDNAE